MEVVQLDPKSLRPHPLNEYIYSPSVGEDHEALKASIRHNGILEPLQVDPTNQIVAGHRRWRIALEIELSSVPAIYKVYEDDLAITTALIESNRQRRKTFSETMREAEVLEKVEAERAKARQGHRTDLMSNVTQSEFGRTREIVADTIGVGASQYRRMKKILEAAKESPHIAEMVAKIDRGEATVHSVYKRVVEKFDRAPEDFTLKVYDMWTFSGLNPKYGQPHPGAIPGDIIENMLWYYTEPGDLIVDPFAGGGVTLDVCKAWNRRYVVSDISPVRDDILKWDVAKGMPPDSQGAALIFLDPPYGNMLAELYSEDSASSMSPSDYIDFMSKVARDGKGCLAPGGKISLIIMKQMFRLPEGVPYIDWPLIMWKVFTSEGLRLVMRIINMWPTNIWMAPQVDRAKDNKSMLPICGDLLVFDVPE